MPGSHYALLPDDGSALSDQVASHLHNSSREPAGWAAQLHDDRTHVDDGVMYDASTNRTSLSDEGFDVKSRDRRTDHRPTSASSVSSTSQHPRSPRGATTKYTALRPSSVEELAYDPESLDPHLPSCRDDEDPDDLEFYDSQTRVNLVQEPTKRITRFHICLCGILTAAFATVGFGLLYVFVILPAHKGHVISPGGRAPTADLIKLKHLGPNVAVTTCGLVRGTFEQGAHVFRGIPYAAPPMGALRWKMPVPLTYDAGTCWQDVLNTTSFGSVCAQPVVSDSTEGGLEKAPHTVEVQGSEDCLYLNVWTPTLNPPESLPVLVWLHSGDFNYGSGHARGMSPSPELAAQTNAVYVSLNYRLGVFGFLALEALRERGRQPLGPTGNYGIMDQQLALHWVKDNARNFGGDPSKITVFGHGSGATSIQALLLSPHSSGLFSSAWMSSPVALLNKTLDEACQDNEPMMAMTGCSNGDCLRRLDSETAIKMSPWSLDPYRTLDQIIQSTRGGQLRNDLAIFDGHVVHWDSMKHGPTGPTVPVVIGATYSDVSSVRLTAPIANLTWDQLDVLLVDELSPLGTEAVVQLKSRYSQMPKAAYSAQSSPVPLNNGYFPLASRQYARLIRDIQAVCPAKILADKLNALFAHSAPIYLYISEAFPSHKLLLEDLSSSSSDGVFVGWDMIAFFGSFREFGFRERQGDISFRDIVSQELLSLARSGKPNASRWRTEGVNTGLLRSEVTVTPAPPNYFDNCDSLRQFDFFHYTWAYNK